MKILELKAENVKRLKAVHITPNGDATVVIGGRNAQGKTSVLDSIEMALAGTDHIPDMPIRNGEEKARIVLTTEEFVVERRFTKTNSYLKVVDAKGHELASPQKILDKIVGSLSFDPLTFARMDGKAQAEEVKRLAGLNFDALEANYKAVFAERTDVNREVKRLEGALAKMPHYPDAPAVEVSAADALAEIRAIGRQRQEKVAAERELADLRNDALKVIAEIETLEHQLGQAKTRLDAIKAKGLAQKEKAESLPAPDNARESALDEHVRTADEINAKVRANRQRVELEKDLQAKQKESETLTAHLNAADKSKKEQLAAAKLPIDGLSFDDALGLMVGGVPFGQCSAAQKLKLSVALGLAANPKLRVLLIRDASLLDEESLAEVAKMAAEANAQVWVERVGKGEECAVIIEDGQVVGAVAEAEPVARPAAAAKRKGSAQAREPGQEG